MNVHLCIDTTALFQFASEHHVPTGSRLQTSLRVPRISSLYALSPVQIVVSLQYSLPVSRHLKFLSHSANKISVQIHHFSH